METSEQVSVDDLIAQSRQAQQRGDFDAMLRLAARASASDPDDLRARFHKLECLIYCGWPDRVLTELALLEARAAGDPAVLAKVAEFYSHCCDHAAAMRCYRKALTSAPANPELLFALAAAEVAMGELESAESHLGEAIAANPHDYDAYRNRSTLRRQHPDDNHVAEMEALLKAGPRTPSGEVQLCYALAKEYEDLGDYPRAFQYLTRGASRRRALLNYRVEGDLQAMQRLAEVFDAGLMEKSGEGCDESGPLFVLGLPRSGTTLVDRILSSHSQVASLGEINNFAYGLMHTVGQAADKLRLIELSSQVNFAALGQRYVDSIRRYGRAGPLLIDKTPLNYLYIGLIGLALPRARIVVVERNAMDSCYGMYRALFRAGYPFSYDFADLARYYAGYRRLMDHWTSVLPEGRLHRVRYESLVNDPEAVSREMIAACGLSWEPACLDFHQNPSAVATASSAQVRRPVYKDAVGRWRRYEQQLQPLRQRLLDAGVELPDD